MIVGTGDHIADPETIKEMIPRWNPDAELKLIPGADHFYWGKDDELTAILREFLSKE